MWYAQNCHIYNSGPIIGKEPRFIATKMKDYFDQRFAHAYLGMIAVAVAIAHMCAILLSGSAHAAEH